MSDYKELKPCPFCGGDAVVEYRPYKGNKLFMAKCLLCGANSKPVSDYKYPADEAIERAIEAWNSRR